MIIVIALKGAIRDVFNKWPGRNRVQITCNTLITCHVVRRDSSAMKFDRV